MILYSALLAITLALVSAEHQITYFSALQPSSSATGTKTIQFNFTFHDNQAAFPFTTQCGASWVLNTAFPTTAFGCQNSTARWQLTAFENVTHFSMETMRSWREYDLEAHGYAAMDAKAKADFAPANFMCSQTSEGAQACGLAGNKTLSLFIYDMSSMYLWELGQWK
jgi:hypothetical protein